MGIDCSKCNGSNTEEKILMMEPHSEKSIKVESRNDKLQTKQQVNVNGNYFSTNNIINVKKSKSANVISNKSQILKIKELIETTIQENYSFLIPKIIRMQALIRKFNDRRIYKVILKKNRVMFLIKLSQKFFSQEEQFETLSKTKFDPNSEIQEKMHSYKTGGMYSGKWLCGFRHGRGLMKWCDGTYYEGQWVYGTAEGKGMLVFMNGDFMKGEFRYNKLNGYGECLNSELGYEYKGYWENDLQTGKGHESWPDGSEYVGMYSQGKKNGFGKYSWIDGSFFIGEWKDNKINGLGLYIWSDGRKFFGEWQNSKMNGYGLFLWKDGRLFKGHYINDKKEGFGIYYGHNGKIYEGMWEEGIHKGLGKYCKKDKSFKVGYWTDTKITEEISSEIEIGLKLKEIDDKVEKCLKKIEEVLNDLNSILNEYIPNVQLENFF